MGELLKLYFFLRVPSNKELVDGTVLVNNFLLAGTTKTLKFLKMSPPPQSTNCAAPKVPKFCPEVEGEPYSLRGTSCL